MEELSPVASASPSAAAAEDPLARADSLDLRKYDPKTLTIRTHDMEKPAGHVVKVTIPKKLLS